MSSPYWPPDLDYEEEIGSQEKPCTGMYLIIDGPGLANLRRTTALEGGQFGVDDLNYAYWTPHPCCPEIASLQNIVILLKDEMGFRYGVHHVRWTVEDVAGGAAVRIPDLQAMIVGPLDGPLERDGEGWPETAAVHAALRDASPPGVIRPWITPRIT
jgi:hypothetical protein